MGAPSGGNFSGLSSLTGQGAAATTAPPPPTAVDPAVLAARQNEQSAAALRQGRSSTILGDPNGELSTDTNTSKKTLLGA